jgi:hypothetical protein
MRTATLAEPQALEPAAEWDYTRVIERQDALTKTN